MELQRPRPFSRPPRCFDLLPSRRECVFASVCQVVGGVAKGQKQKKNERKDYLCHSCVLGKCAEASLRVRGSGATVCSSQ